MPKNEMPNKLYPLTYTDIPFDEDADEYVKAKAVNKLVEALEKALIDILECDKSRYKTPEQAIDAIYAIAFYALPEDKRPHSKPDIILSQIGLGKALSELEK